MSREPTYSISRKKAKEVLAIFKAILESTDRNPDPELERKGVRQLFLVACVIAMTREDPTADPGDLYARACILLVMLGEELGL